MVVELCVFVWENSNSANEVNQTIATNGDLVYVNHCDQWQVDSLSYSKLSLGL